MRLGNLPFPKRQKPVPGRPVDWSHRLASGLVGCWLFHEGAGQLAAGKTPTPHNAALGGTGAGFDGGRYGGSAFAWPSGMTAGSLTPVNTGADWLPTSAVTVVLGYRKTDTTARSSGAFGFNADAASGTNRLGAHVPFSDGTVYFDFGGSTTGTTRVTWSGWTRDILPHVWTFSAGPAGMEIWLDGQRRANNSATPSRTADTSKSWLIGSGNTLSSDAAEGEFCYVYNRQLSAAEIVALSVEPFAFFLPPLAALAYSFPARTGGLLMRRRRVLA